MRITIGGPPRHKPAYQLADRVKCRECGKQGSADCEDCPAKMIYDELDEISKRPTGPSTRQFAKIVGKR